MGIIPKNNCMDKPQNFSNLSKAIIAVLTIGLGILFFLYQQKIQDYNSLSSEKGKCAKEFFKEEISAFTIGPKNLDPIRPSLADSCRRDFMRIPFTFLYCMDGTKKPLTGWKVDAGELNKFIDSKSPDEIFLLPAMKPEKQSNGTEKPSSEYITLLVMGLDTSNTDPSMRPEILVDETTGKPYIYEYINPCPPRCPTNYSRFFQQ